MPLCGACACVCACAYDWRPQTELFSEGDGGKDWLLYLCPLLLLLLSVCLTVLGWG